MSINNQYTIHDVITWHLTHKQNLQVQDVYKLLYQSVYGPAHILSNLDAAKAYLEKELREIKIANDEPLFEPLSLDKKIVRVNLRPYKLQGGETEMLFQVLQESARAIRGNDKDFNHLWDTFVTLVNSQKMDFDNKAVALINEQKQRVGIQQMHHSSEYRLANKPSYRVISLPVFQKYWQKN